MLTLPVILSISPKKADTRELFPEPTVPTTATREPCWKLRLMLRKTGSSSVPHENVPFSITRGFSEIIRFYHFLNDKFHSSVLARPAHEYKFFKTVHPNFSFMCYMNIQNRKSCWQNEISNESWENICWVSFVWNLGSRSTANENSNLLR